MRLRQRDWLRGALSIALLVALGFVGRRYLGELHRLRDADLAWVALLAGLILVTRAIHSEITWLSLRVLGQPLRRTEVVLLTFLRSYSNLLVPRAGIGVIAAYLKSKHGIRFADSTSLLMPSLVLQMVVVGFLGLAAQPILQAFGVFGVEAVPLAFSIVFGLTFVIGVGGVLLRLPTPESWTGPVGRFARRLGSSWQTLGNSRSLLARVSAIHTLLVALRVTQWWVAFSALGLDPHKLGLLVASLLSDVMLFISITPNALGFQEAAMVYSADVIGVEATLVLTAAVLHRIVVTGVVVIVAQLALAAAFIERGSPDADE